MVGRSSGSHPGSTIHSGHKLFEHSVNLYACLSPFNLIWQLMESPSFKYFLQISTPPELSGRRERQMIKTGHAKNGTKAKNWLMWVREKIIQSKEWTRSRNGGLLEKGGRDDRGSRGWCPGVCVHWMPLTLIKGDCACQQTSVWKQWLSPTVSLPFFHPCCPLSDLFIDSFFFPLASLFPLQI